MESIQENREIEEELEKIKKYVEKSENPLIFFDDDHDGLISYILLKKNYDKCKGIIVKAGMKDETIYFRKIKEYSPDLILILDRAEISQELIDSVSVPIIWIDHHPLLDRKGVNYFNPRKYDSNDNRPTSFWCYNLVKNNLWVALVGIFGDYYLPVHLIENFEYSELLENKSNIEDILYTTKYGKLVKIFNFVLKGSTSEVRKNINMLCKLENPYELLDKKTPRGKYLYGFYEKINKTYKLLWEMAVKSSKDKKLLLFLYPESKISLSGLLSSELAYKYPDKLIMVGREKDSQLRFSLRGKNFMLPPLFKKAIEGLEGYGGGHDHAVGGNISMKDFPEFIKRIKEGL